MKALRNFTPDKAPHPCFGYVLKTRNGSLFHQADASQYHN